MTLQSTVNVNARYAQRTHECETKYPLSAKSTLILSSTCKPSSIFQAAALYEHWIYVSVYYYYYTGDLEQYQMMMQTVRKLSNSLAKASERRTVSNTHKSIFETSTLAYSTHSLRSSEYNRRKFSRRLFYLINIRSSWNDASSHNRKVTKWAALCKHISTQSIVFIYRWLTDLSPETAETVEPLCFNRHSFDLFTHIFSLNRKAMHDNQAARHIAALESGPKAGHNPNSSSKSLESVASSKVVFAQTNKQENEKKKR